MNFNAMKDLVIDGWIILKGSSFIPNKAKTTSNLFFMISLRNMLWLIHLAHLQQLCMEAQPNTDLHSTYFTRVHERGYTKVHLSI